MNLSLYREELANNIEYVEAEKRLQAKFALGNAILRGRIQRGWSQSELAKAVGTKQANISRIEAALANPTLDLIKRLCDTLGIELRFEEKRQAVVVEVISKEMQKFSTTTTKMPERVDNQPDHVFCPHFRASSVRDVQEGLLE